MCILPTAVALVLGSMTLEASAQTTTLVATATNGQTTSVLFEVGTNEVVQVIHAVLEDNPSVYSVKLEVLVGAATFTYTKNSASLPIVAGPATLRLVVQNRGTAGPTSALCSVSKSLKLTELTTPSTAVVIPDDAGGPVEIILESSTDLVSWIPTNPGTYGTSTPQRFFRVRAQRQ
jgi:hypothetical protein